MVVGITGHRKCDNMFERGMKMNYEIWDLMNSGYDTFVVGMAEGADTIAADFILALREHGYAVRLVVLLPYPDFGMHDKERRRIIEKADVVEVVCDKYEKWCYDKRDKRIVDYSNKMIGMLDPDREKSGTGRTIAYARRKGITCRVV